MVGTLVSFGSICSVKYRIRIFTTETCNLCYYPSTVSWINFERAPSHGLLQPNSFSVGNVQNAFPCHTLRDNTDAICKPKWLKSTPFISRADVTPPSQPFSLLNHRPPESQDKSTRIRYHQPVYHHKHRRLRWSYLANAWKSKLFKPRALHIFYCFNLKSATIVVRPSSSFTCGHLIISCYQRKLDSGKAKPMI